MDSLFAAAFCVTLFLLISLCPVSRIVGLTDQPCSRKRHSGEVPLIGGLSIFLCILFMYRWMPFSNHAYISAATLLVVCGVIDDYKPISVKIRFAVQIMASIIMIRWGGVEITSIGNILGFGDIELGIFGPTFTVIAVLGGINAINMLDGIDGLVGGFALIAFIFLFAITNTPEIASLCLVLIPAIAAFLFFNMRVFGRKKASIFLGDTGSMLFGFTLCWMLISMSQSESSFIVPVTVLWVLGFPVLDTITIMVRRKARGKSPFAADREHFHHLLLLLGFSVNQTVAIIVLLSCGFAGFGVLGTAVFELPEWAMFALFLSVASLYYLGLAYTWKMMKISRQLQEPSTGRRKEVESGSSSSISQVDTDRRNSLGYASSGRRDVVLAPNLLMKRMK